MRAVVDTNVLVSGLMYPPRMPAQVLAAIAALALTPVVCTAVMDEYRRVLQRPRLRLPSADVVAALRLIEGLAEWVAVPAYTGVPALPDPADWPFIACALAAGCPVITGNSRHFPDSTGVVVMSVRDWVERSGGG